MSISLEVGKTYVNRAGREVAIDGYLDKNIFPQMYENGFRFIDASGFAYKPNGSWCFGDQSSSQYDLVSEAERGESLGDILGAALAERDKNANATYYRLRVNRDQIINDLGYVAGNGLKSTAIKLHRAIFGTEFNEAKKAIEEVIGD